jgi:Domain of unknown function (DUF362)
MRTDQGKEKRMGAAKKAIIDSPLGKQEADSDGPPVGVVRMDAARSYAGVGELLQSFINNGDQNAWEEIRKKIDYTYEGLDLALGPLEAETGFRREIADRLAQGRKLLFKPNLVGIGSINPQTHGPDKTNTTNTAWPFVAALMRWFHDQAGISYYQMIIGEAASMMPAMAGFYSLVNPNGRVITVEAAIEGRSGDFYGGWGFYFVRKYLADSLPAGATDDPMSGYEESVVGTYVPPGLAAGKLMVYDLNRICDDPGKGREIPVSGGINYQSIVLHKAVVGGDPDDPEDMKAYPGCVLVNVPKFKVHAITLFTNVIKNLGIGLYPMQYASTGGCEWDYSIPHTSMPGMKSGIPHQVWVPELDLETAAPKRDSDGNYIVKKTGGITATMVDINRAVLDQGIFMVHVTDGIETINLDHTGSGFETVHPEGMVFAGLDPVATDLLSARYMFSNVPLAEALEAQVDDGAGGCFPQAVPLPVLQDGNIVTKPGYDCPLSRDVVFEQAERRGMGQRKYHVVGHDRLTDSPLVSIQGHLGAVSDGAFSDVITGTLFYDLFKLPWDMQRTAFSYFDAVDTLTGSILKQEFLQAFDEDGDGIVNFEDTGTKGVWVFGLLVLGEFVSLAGSERLGCLKGNFQYNATITRMTNPLWNPHGHDVSRELFHGFTCYAAYQISLADMEAPDPFVPGLTFGKGKWPSQYLASFFFVASGIYGREFPAKVGPTGLYSTALFYADLKQNGGRYAGEALFLPDEDGAMRYISDVSDGKVEPLDFTIYVPPGFEAVPGITVPNVEATADPARVFTASFDGGQEVWNRIAT